MKFPIRKYKTTGGFSTIGLSLLAAMVFSAAACGTTPSSENATSRGDQEGRTVAGSLSQVSIPEGANQARMSVRGLSCPLCAHNVDVQLLRMKSIKQVEVDLGTGLVLVDFDPNEPPSADALARAVRNSGFTVEKIEFHAKTGVNGDE